MLTDARSYSSVVKHWTVLPESGCYSTSSEIGCCSTSSEPVVGCAPVVIPVVVSFVACYLVFCVSVSSSVVSFVEHN